MATNTLQSLQSAPTVADLMSRLKGVESYFHEPERSSQIPESVQRILASNPALANVKVDVRSGTPGGYYPGSDTIALGVNNPDVIGHEAAHAENVREAPIYRKLLNTTSNIARINNIAAIPAMLAIRALVGDVETRREILNILSGASAAIAAPELVEELGASVTAVKNAPDKLQAIKTLLPAFLQHAMVSSLPVGVYQLGKHI